MKKLLSIDQEAEACRKAFKGVEVGTIVQHCHHEQWLEIQTEPAENRIAFILNNKDERERALRLRLFRPLLSGQYRKLPTKLKRAYADRQKADADWWKAYAEPESITAHEEICGCKWSAKTDIFGEKR